MFFFLLFVIFVLSTSQFPKGLLPFSTDTPVDCQRDRQASQIGCFLAGGILKKNNQILSILFSIIKRSSSK